MDYVIYGTTQNCPQQIVLPSHLKRVILRKMHDDMGHQVRDQTLSLDQDRFYWLSMARGGA